MLPKGIKALIFINIYILLFVNAGLFISVYAIKYFNSFSRGKYTVAYKSLKPLVLAAIDDTEAYNILVSKISNRYCRKIVFDILLAYVSKNNFELSHMFEKLGYVDFLLVRAKKRVSLEIIKQFALIRSERAFSILFNATFSNDFEIKYRSYYALSLLKKLETVKVEQIVNNLLKSGIMRNRIIEIIHNFNLSAAQCFDFLARQGTGLGKNVFLKVISDNKETLKCERSNELIKYLDDSKETRIATVLAIASTKKAEYIKVLFELYQQEQSWEVRSAIAKSFINYPAASILEPLKVMVYDTEWWVRFNALEVLSKLGIDGVDAIIDLSLETMRKDVSNLAYYILNANKDVYQTVKENYS